MTSRPRTLVALVVVAAVASSAIASGIDRHPELKSRALAWTEYDGSYLIDTKNRGEMLDFFWTVMARPYPDPGWTGSLNPPNAGETSELWRLREYAQLNAIRALNYSQAMTEATDKLPMVQAGALLLELNPTKWTHFADASWVGYNELGAKGVLDSALGGIMAGAYRGYGEDKKSTGGLADGFVFDVGNDAEVGHRTVLLHDATKKSVLGAALNQYGFGTGVWYPEREYGNTDPTRFVAWPAEGFFPYAPLRLVADRVRWSFTLASDHLATTCYPNANLSAKVNGKPVRVVNLVKNGSISGLTWGFDQADFDAAKAPDGTTVEITVSNIVGAPVGDTTVRTYTYAVTFFDEDVILPAGYSPQTPLVNLSTRGNIGNADQQMITGFGVTGTLPVRIALRTQGPALAAHGISSPARKTRVKLYDAAGKLLGENAGWRQHQDWRLLKSYGLAPIDDNEAAMVATLWPGNYTAVVSDDTGANGVGIVEAFNIDSHSTSRLANLSTRGYVGNSEQALIAGIVVVNTARTVVIRTQGPALAKYGIANPVSDTVLTLISQNGGKSIAANDDWQTETLNERLKTDLAGLAPSDPREAAIVITLQPGAYTALVAAKANPGVGIVELFDVGAVSP